MTQSDLNTAMALWISQYPFTHFASLGFLKHVDLHSAMGPLKKWRFNIIDGENIGFAYMGVINYRPYSHLHLLLMGSNSAGKTLNDIPDSRWRRYESLWRGDANVKPVYDRQGVSEYIVKRNMPVGQYEVLVPLNKRRLTRSLKVAA